MNILKSCEKISFHDSVIIGIEITMENLCFSLSHVDVLKDNPLNNSNMGKKTDGANLLLHGFKIESIIKLMANGNKQVLAVEGFSELLDEIINGEINSLENSSDSEIEILIIGRNQPIVLKIKYCAMTLTLGDYVGKAWFDNL